MQTPYVPDERGRIQTTPSPTGLVDRCLLSRAAPTALPCDWPVRRDVPEDVAEQLERVDNPNAPSGRASARPAK